MVFHLGFQKTGSTTMQAFLNRNAEALPEIDVRAYGDATKDLRVSGRNWCADPSPARWQRLADALDRHVERFAAGRAQVCLISDENVVGRVGYGPTGDVLRWSEAILPLIAERAAAFDPGFVFYTRAPDRWLRSLYNQSVKRARVTQGFERWAAAAPFEVDWPAWRERLASAAGRPVTFLSMEEELASGRPLGAGLLVECGVPPDVAASLPAAEARNASLSERSLRLMRLVNRLPLGDRRVIRFSEWLERQHWA